MKTYAVSALLKRGHFAPTGLLVGCLKELMKLKMAPTANFRKKIG